MSSVLFDDIRRNNSENRDAAWRHNMIPSLGCLNSYLSDCPRVRFRCRRPVLIPIIVRSIYISASIRSANNIVCPKLLRTELTTIFFVGFPMIRGASARFHPFFEPVAGRRWLLHADSPACRNPTFFYRDFIKRRVDPVRITFGRHARPFNAKMTAEPCRGKRFCVVFEL